MLLNYPHSCDHSLHLPTIRLRVPTFKQFHSCQGAALVSRISIERTDTRSSGLHHLCLACNRSLFADGILSTLFRFTNKPFNLLIKTVRRARSVGTYLFDKNVSPSNCCFLWQQRPFSKVSLAVLGHNPPDNPLPPKNNVCGQNLSARKEDHNFHLYC